MRTHKTLLAVLATTFLLASPAAALAQSAGDKQYADPLAGDNSGQTQKAPSGGNSGTQGNDQLADSGTTGTATPQGSDPSPTTATQAQAGSTQLPRTGLDLVMFVVTGAVMLLAGVVIRRIASRPTLQIR